MLVLPMSIIPARATTYLPAVTSGQWVQYKPSYYHCESTSPSICDGFSSSSGSIGNTNYGTLRVLSVSGTKVTIEMGTLYKNETASHQTGVVDVSTGSSNLTGVPSQFATGPTDYFVLAGGLQSQDKIWNTPAAPAFNQTKMVNVLGVERSVNFLNFSQTLTIGTGDFSSKSGFAFDQVSGILIEISFSYTTHSQGGTTGIVTTLAFSLSMTGNNIWLSSRLPDFTLSSSGAISFPTGSTGNATITITGSDGFGSPVNLEVASSSSSLNCTLDKYAISGSEHAVLICKGQPGTYSVTIKATGGLASHSSQVPVEVKTLSAVPNQPGNILSSYYLYAGIGAVIAAIVAGVLLFLRKKPETVTPSVVGETPPPPSPPVAQP